MTRARLRGPAVSTSSLGELGHVSHGPQVEELPQVTRAHVRGPTGSNSAIGALLLMSEGPRCGPALPGDTSP